MNSYLVIAVDSERKTRSSLVIAETPVEAIEETFPAPDERSFHVFRIDWWGRFCQEDGLIQLVDAVMPKAEEKKAS